MARHIDLRDLIPPDDERDKITMKDGVEFFLPELGVKEMAKLLTTEEDLTEARALDELTHLIERVSDLMEKANPGRSFDYDFTIEEFTVIVGAIAGADSAHQAVRDALARDPDSLDPATTEDAVEAAAELGEAAGTRDEDDESPLASPKRSQKRSSRSETSVTGGRSGGKGSAGKSSSRTSAKRKTSSAA